MFSIVTYLFPLHEVKESKSKAVYMSDDLDPLFFFFFNEFDHTPLKIRLLFNFIILPYEVENSCFRPMQYALSFTNGIHYKSKQTNKG
jgi:hypothetical protein